MLTVCDHIEVDAKGVARIAGSRIKVVYYHDHEEEIDRQIAEGEAYVRAMEAKMRGKQPKVEALRARFLRAKGRL